MEEELRAAVSAKDWLERMKHRLDGRADQDNDNNTAAAVWLTVG